MRIFYHSVHILTWVLFLSNCQTAESEHHSDNIEPVAIRDFELFAGFEQQGLVRPVQIEVLPNGNVAVLDNQTNKIHILGLDGEIITSFGGEGSGPGETLMATQLQKSNDYLFVVDSNQNRINQFNHEGELIHSFNFDSGRFQAYVTIVNDKSYFAMSHGKNEKLIRQVDVVTDSSFYFGEALGEEGIPFDLDAERKALQKGELPEFMKNQVTMSFSDDHLYVFLNVFSRHQKYSMDGELLWDQEINLPVNQVIFEKVVERAHAPESRGGVPVLRYILSMKVVNGQPYLLWHPGKEYPQHLVKTDNEGHLETVYDMQDDTFLFFDFAIDSKNNILYLIDSETEQIYRTKLPV